ncbi:uncharacterized protein J8A68_004970 [[Candida] subhashii]|uniref:Zn(2)-C6 fungal-type domain-containing protein n=1 Tax=[Candida] subhashii TaxID=561895 RepID=A0A8J5QI15_9ASCO|nr:uncharacterized protein J8A68_004970 [[Candida] subhashii]KAG7661511.1 hypothetical protein J8A68_004970 [[Candida] subhashii]
MDRFEGQSFIGESNNSIDPVGESGTGSPSEENQSRKRIRVACDICRKKKIKCDGSFPCTNCTQARDATCHYTVRPVKKKSKAPAKDRSINKKSDSNDRTNKTVKILETRMSSLENAIYGLTRQLTNLVEASRSQGSSLVTQASRRFGIEAGVEGEEQNESDSSQRSVSPDIAGATRGSSNEPSRERRASEATKLALKLGNVDQYIGSHSMLCIFSNNSLSWMENMMGEGGAEVIKPVRNLPVVYYSKLGVFLKKWIDPPVVDKAGRLNLLESPFPTDAGMVYELVDNYYRDIAMVNVLVSSVEARKLFGDYYKIQSEPRVQKRKRFKLSELMKLTGVLLLAISNKFDKDSVAHFSTPTSVRSDSHSPLAKYSDHYLLELQSKLFDAAIYYYQRISIISEGLETIEAILILIIYMDGSWASSFINYIPISIAIRYAQDMGLHRAETYNGFSLPEQDRRRAIWSYCHYYDTEMCYRSGKPPLINDNDVTINDTEDLKQFCITHYKGKLLDDNTIPVETQFLTVLQQTDPESLYHFLMLSISKIRSKSYNQLFIASAQNRDFRSVARTLDQLNAEMFELAGYMADGARPRFYNDPQFHFIDENWPPAKKESTIAMQMTFFLHLSIMNRIPTMVSAENIGKFGAEALKFRSLSLDAARTIMVLSKQISKDIASLSYLNWILNFPVNAFLILAAAVMNHPQSTEAYNDLQLLIDFATNVFNSSRYKLTNEVSLANEYSDKDFVLRLVVRVFLNVVIKAFESQTNSEILSTNPPLREYLETTSVLFPDLYKDRADISAQFSQVFGASPFTKDPNNYNSRPTSVNSVAKNEFVSSPRYNPAVSNILHHSNDVQGAPSYNNISQSQPGNFRMKSEFGPDPPFTAPNIAPMTQEDSYDVLSNYLYNEGAPNAFFNQVNNLPNFFFDNNLGV